MEEEYIKHIDEATADSWDADLSIRIKAKYISLGSTRVFNRYTNKRPAISKSTRYSLVNGDYDLVATAPELALKILKADAILDGMAMPV